MRCSSRGGTHSGAVDRCRERRRRPRASSSRWARPRSIPSSPRSTPRRAPTRSYGTGTAVWSSSGGGARTRYRTSRLLEGGRARGGRARAGEERTRARARAHLTGEDHPGARPTTTPRSRWRRACSTSRRRSRTRCSPRTWSSRTRGPAACSKPSRCASHCSWSSTTDSWTITRRNSRRNWGKGDTCGGANRTGWRTRSTPSTHGD